MADPEVKNISTPQYTESERSVMAAHEVVVDPQRTIRGPQGETVRVTKGNAPVRHRGGVNYSG